MGSEDSAKAADNAIPMVGAVSAEAAISAMDAAALASALKALARHADPSVRAAASAAIRDLSMCRVSEGEQHEYVEVASVPIEIDEADGNSVAGDVRDSAEVMNATQNEASARCLSSSLWLGS